MRITATLVFLLAATLAAAPASALIIDNFEEGGFSLTDTTPSSGSEFGPTETLNPANTIDGQRRAGLNLSSGSVAHGDLATTAGADSAILFLPSGAQGNLWMDYFIPSGTIDVTADGATAIRIQVSAAPGTSEGLGQIYAQFLDGSSNGHTEFVTIVGPTIVYIPFANYSGVDLTDIDYIKIGMRVLTAPLTGGSRTIAIGHVETVPEPHVAFLLAGPLVLLALNRRRSGRIRTI